MGLRSEENKNRKLNRADAGRRGGQQPGLFDLRGENGNYSDSSGASGFSAGSGSDRQDGDRPYRERHRVEISSDSDPRSSGGYSAGRELEVPEIVRGNKPGAGRYGSGSYGNRSSSYGNRGTDRYGSGNYGNRPSSYGNRGTDRYGSGNYGNRTSSYGNRDTSRYGSADSYSGSRTDGGAQASGNYGNRTSSYGNRGTGRYESADFYSGSRTDGGTQASGNYGSRNVREISDWNFSDRPGSARDSYGSGANGYDRGRTGNRVVRGNVPGGRREEAPGADRGREINADLFVPNNYGANGRKSRVTRVPISSVDQTRDNLERERRSAGRNSRYTGEDRTSEIYDGFYTAPSSLNTPPAGSGGTGRPGDYGRSGRNQAGSGKRDYEQDYFYEEELPAENLLWDGIGDDPDETASDKRLRQRERIRKQREEELKKMYFRLGAGAAVALVVVIAVIAIAVAGLRGGKKKDQTAGAGTETTQTADASGKEKEPSADGSAGRDAGAESGQKADGKETEQTPGGPAEETGTDKKDAGSESPQDAENPQDAAEEKADSLEDVDAELPQETESTDTADAQEKKDTQTSPAEGENAEASEAENAEGENAEGENADAQNADAAAEDAQSADADNAEAGDVTPAVLDPAQTTYARQDEWNLVLVNPWNSLPEGFTVETTSLLNGESVDSRCYSALKQMLDDCQAKSGGIPIVCSSYRPHDKQVRLFKEQVAKNMKEGMTREEAEKEAGTVVAVPGTSENEIGLAVDICDSENQLLDESQANTDTQKWLMANCWDYGFILRYPVSKSEITGIIYEPWHYRYVGVEAAKEIQARGVCLEEYLAE